MKPRWLIHRFFALFLALCLAAPSPAAALRPQSDRSGLEEKFSPVRPEPVEGQSSRPGLEEEWDSAAHLLAQGLIQNFRDGNLANGQQAAFTLIREWLQGPGEDPRQVVDQAAEKLGRSHQDYWKQVVHVRLDHIREILLNRTKLPDHIFLRILSREAQAVSGFLKSPVFDLQDVREAILRREQEPIQRFRELKTPIDEGDPRWSSDLVTASLRRAGRVKLFGSFAQSGLRPGGDLDVMFQASNGTQGKEWWMLLSIPLQAGQEPTLQQFERWFIDGFLAGGPTLELPAERIFHLEDGNFRIAGDALLGLLAQNQEARRQIRELGVTNEWQVAEQAARLQQQWLDQSAGLEETGQERVVRLLEAAAGRSADQPFQICFLCNQNIERSPMLQLLLRDFLAKRGMDWVQVESGAVLPLLTGELVEEDDSFITGELMPAVQDQRISPVLIEEMTQRAPQMASGKLLRKSDLILVTSRFLLQVLEAKLREELDAGEPEKIQVRLLLLRDSLSDKSLRKNLPAPDWGAVDETRESQVRQIMDRVVTFPDFLGPTHRAISSTTGSLNVLAASGDADGFIADMREALWPLSHQLELIQDRRAGLEEGIFSGSVPEVLRWVESQIGPDGRTVLLPHWKYREVSGSFRNVADSLSRGEQSEFLAAQAGGNVRGSGALARIVRDGDSAIAYILLGEMMNPQLIKTSPEGTELVFHVTDVEQVPFIAKHGLFQIPWREVFYRNERSITLPGHLQSSDVILAFRLPSQHLLGEDVLLGMIGALRTVSLDTTFGMGAQLPEELRQSLSHVPIPHGTSMEKLSAPERTALLLLTAEKSGFLIRIPPDSLDWKETIAVNQRRPSVRGARVVTPAVWKTFAELTSAGLEEVLPSLAELRHKVAVVGAGPAGLAAAMELRRLGHEVDIFSDEAEHGGLAIRGLYPDKEDPGKIAYRFRTMGPIVVAPGIHFHGNVPIGRYGALATEDFQAMGYSAVVVAIGAYGSKRLNIPGEDQAGLTGLYQAKDLVGFYNGDPDQEGLDPKLGKTMAVVGLGNANLDVTRYGIYRRDYLAADLFVRSLSPEEWKHLLKTLKRNLKNKDNYLRRSLNLYRPGVGRVVEVDELRVALQRADLGEFVERLDAAWKATADITAVHDATWLVRRGPAEKQTDPGELEVLAPHIDLEDLRRELRAKAADLGWGADLSEEMLERHLYDLLFGKVRKSGQRMSNPAYESFADEYYAKTPWDELKEEYAKKMALFGTRMDKAVIRMRFLVRAESMPENHVRGTAFKKNRLNGARLVKTDRDAAREELFGGNTLDSLVLSIGNEHDDEFGFEREDGIFRKRVPLAEGEEPSLPGHFQSLTQENVFFLGWAEVPSDGKVGQTQRRAVDTVTIAVAPYLEERSGLKKDKATHRANRLKLNEALAEKGVQVVSGGQSAALHAWYIQNGYQPNNRNEILGIARALKEERIGGSLGPLSSGMRVFAQRGALPQNSALRTKAAQLGIEIVELPDDLERAGDVLRHAGDMSKSVALVYPSMEWFEREEWNALFAETKLRAIQLAGVLPYVVGDWKIAHWAALFGAFPQPGLHVVLSAEQESRTLWLYV